MVDKTCNIHGKPIDSILIDFNHGAAAETELTKMLSLQCPKEQRGSALEEIDTQLAHSSYFIQTLYKVS